MLRSRRFVLISSVVVLGLASTSCGDDRRISGTSSTNAVATPPVIRVGSGSGSTSPMSSEADSKMMAPYGQTVYIYDGDLPELGGTARAWRFPAGAQPDPERVAAIARLLGVEGEVSSLPVDQGGGWMVGPADYSGATLSVGADGMLSWWFSPSPDVWGGGVACAAPEPAPVDSTVEGTLCEEPLPPANVPDEATALHMAEELFAELGYDVTTLDLDAYADEWGANVAAYVLLDGERSPMSMSVGFGAEGVVTWASGFLAEPEVVGEYPMVGAPAGLLRLQDETGRWMWYGVATLDAAASDTPVARNATDTAPVADVPAETMPTETMPADTLPVETMPVDTLPVETMPVETVPMEVFEIHLVGVHLGLTMVWDVDGTVWLLPAYVFTTADGGEFAVVGIEDGFIELPEALPVPEPLPAESAASS